MDQHTQLTIEKNNPGITVDKHNGKFTVRFLNHAFELHNVHEVHGAVLVLMRLEPILSDHLGFSTHIEHAKTECHRIRTSHALGFDQYIPD